MRIERNLNPQESRPSPFPTLLACPDWPGLTPAYPSEAEARRALTRALETGVSRAKASICVLPFLCKRVSRYKASKRSWNTRCLGLPTASCVPLWQVSISGRLIGELNRLAREDFRIQQDVLHSSADRVALQMKITLSCNGPLSCIFCLFTRARDVLSPSSWCFSPTKQCDKTTDQRSSAHLEPHADRKPLSPEYDVEWTSQLAEESGVPCRHLRCRDSRVA